MNKIAACAIIHHPTEDLFLAVSRKHNHEAFGFPGGAVEPGESLTECMIREVKEETGLDVKVCEEIFSSIDEEGWECTAFDVLLCVGALETKEDIVIKWATKKELIDGPFGRYNEKLFERYKDAL